MSPTSATRVSPRGGATALPAPASPAARLAGLLSAPDISPDAGGVRIARGQLAGRPAWAFATDPAVQGGALGAEGCAQICRAYEAARAEDVPVVGLWHSGGARLREGVLGLDGVGRVFAAMTGASGQIPQVSVVLGAAAGGAAYGPALTDVVIMTPEARVFVTGPDVVRSVTGEDLDAATLGGPEVHTRRSGVAALLAEDPAGAYRLAGTVADLLRRPSGPVGVPAQPDAHAADPGSLLPESPRRAYDVRPVISALLDRAPVELHARWAPNVVTALGRLAGRAVGVVANNPLRLGGCLDATSADKAARFVRMCDAFGIPLIVLVDVPGYLPGGRQESDGVLRRGAKLLHAFAACSVPRLTVILRKAYGGAYIAMNSASLGATAVYAWPGADVAVMGPVAAARILHRRELAGVAPEQLADAETAFAERLAREQPGMADALDRGLVDAVVAPARTRALLAATLADCAPRRGRLTNIPL